MKTRARKTLKQLKAIVNDWNAKYPVGTEVNLIDGFGQRPRTHTRSEAQILSGHSAVVWLEGVSGCWNLEFVNPVKVKEKKPARAKRGGSS